MVMEVNSIARIPIDPRMNFPFMFKFIVVSAITRNTITTSSKNKVTKTSSPCAKAINGFARRNKDKICFSFFISVRRKILAKGLEKITGSDHNNFTTLLYNTCRYNNIINYDEPCRKETTI